MEEIFVIQYASNMKNSEGLKTTKTFLTKAGAMFMYDKLKLAPNVFRELTLYTMVPKTIQVSVKSMV